MYLKGTPRASSACTECLYRYNTKQPIIHHHPHGSVKTPAPLKKKKSHIEIKVHFHISSVIPDRVPYPSP